MLCRPTAEEEARAGLRRGRSAAAVVLTGTATDTPDMGTPASTPAHSDMNDAEAGSDNPDGDPDDVEDGGTGNYNTWPSRPGQAMGQHSGRDLQHLGGAFMPDGGTDSVGRQEPSLPFLANASLTAGADAKWPQYQVHAGGAGGGPPFQPQSPQADLSPQVRFALLALPSICVENWVLLTWNSFPEFGRSSLQ